MFQKKENKESVFLEDVSQKNQDFIVKYYFPEVPVSYRNKIKLTILQKNRNISIEEFNKECYETLVHLENEKREHLPKLIYSIILNSLAFEANDDLKDSLYGDYKDKAIAKHSKPFINAQFKIYRNANEQLLNISEEQTNATIKEVEDTIKLILKVGLIKINKALEFYDNKF